MSILQRYVDTGIADLSDKQDVLNVYLVNIMNDPLIKVQVLGSEVCASIFMNVMLRFINDIIDKMKFKCQMAQSDIRQMGETMQWSYRKKQDGWQGLVFMLDSKYGDYGFDKNFYIKTFSKPGRLENDKTTWEKMIYDWNEALKQKMRHDVGNSIDSADDANEKKLNSYMNEIPKYLKQEQIDKDDFMQAWGMMNGSWNTSDFQRLIRIVHLQQQYPQIVKITNKMGRIASDDGSQWLSLVQGSTQKVEHSSHSDILGVTVGNDINALMPTEMAYASDDQLEDVFLNRFVSHKLQVFRYKSEVMKPARQMNICRMMRRGPMIVCVDTSGSMVGKPEKISHSVLLRILSIAHQQRRSCFLIGFSVSINPIDVVRNTSMVLNFFSHGTSGDTNASRMLDKIFELIETNDRYMNADILWVSDYRIPMPDKSQLLKIQHYRTIGTRFYGLQIGVSVMVETWRPYFDEIEQISYTHHRLY